MQGDRHRRRRGEVHMASRSVQDRRRHRLSFARRRFCPSDPLSAGVDIFFDNVGGDMLQAAVDNMAKFGRIVLCGQIAGYNDQDVIPAFTNMMRVIYASVRLQGFLFGDYKSAVPEALADIIRSEEHTSELQSLMRISYAVFCLKKKK